MVSTTKVIQDETVVSWASRLPLPEGQIDDTIKRIQLRKPYKREWSDGIQEYQVELQQSMLSLWASLFDDIEPYSEELEEIGYQHYNKIVEMVRDRKLGKKKRVDIWNYATVMAKVIVAQRELLATVMPSIRKDTQYGYDMLRKTVEGGKSSQKERRKELESKWKMWQKEYDDIKERFPTMPDRSIAVQVAKKCGGKAEAIRRRIREMKKASASPSDSE